MRTLLSAVAMLDFLLYNGTEKCIFENISVDMTKHCAFMDGVLVETTPKELDLLVLFIKNVNIALFRNKIFEMVWDGDFEVDTRTVDIHVQRIRKKFKLEGKLKTIYKVGYRLESAEQ